MTHPISILTKNVLMITSIISIKPLKIFLLIIAGLLATGCSNPVTEQNKGLVAAKANVNNHPYKGANHKLVIAHRGASGYLPEHTMEAKVLAFAQGAHFIEQDLVMTKDGQVVVLHDITLENTTNVKQRFPDRMRKDGRFYVIDFTLDELLTLSVSERFNDKNDEKKAAYPNRFPIETGRFSVHTFEEEIQVIQNLNRLLGKKVGIYPEIKSPAFHRNEGHDLSLAVLSILNKYGYTSKTSPVYVQSFDPIELQRIRNELLPQLQMELKLVQLIAYSKWNETLIYKNGKVIPYDYSWMFAAEGMTKIAEYADGIGPWKSMLITPSKSAQRFEPTAIVNDAHKAGLVVHPYTFRADPERIPDYVQNFDELLDLFLFTFGVDGVFTDFPDKAVSVINNEQNNPRN